MQFSEAQLASMLQQGRKLQCECNGHNTFYQFNVLTYRITFVDGKYIMSCLAGAEYQLWRMEYESLAELLKNQTFDLNRFRMV